MRRSTPLGGQQPSRRPALNADREPRRLPDLDHDVWNGGVFGHTSPIYVASGTREWQRMDNSGVQYVLTLVEGSLESIRHIAPRHADGRVTHHHGESVHQA
jgi:hypothetical protein